MDGSGGDELSTDLGEEGVFPEFDEDELEKMRDARKEPIMHPLVDADKDFMEDVVDGSMDGGKGGIMEGGNQDGGVGGDVVDVSVAPMHARKRSGSQGGGQGPGGRPRNRRSHSVRGRDHESYLKLLRWPPTAAALARGIKPPHSVVEYNQGTVVAHWQSQTLKAVDFSGHILVSCSHDFCDLYYFLAHLRTACGDGRPVVVLTQRQPSHYFWGCVGIFPDVFNVMGSPLVEADLCRAGCMTADHILILSSEPLSKTFLEGSNPRLFEAYNLCNPADADALRAMKVISRLLGADAHHRVTLELISPTSVRLMHESVRSSPAHVKPPSSDLSRLPSSAQGMVGIGAKVAADIGEEIRIKTAGYMETDVVQMYAGYAMGQILWQSAFECLIYRDFYNPRINDMVSQLISGRAGRGNTAGQGGSDHAGVTGQDPPAFAATFSARHVSPPQPSEPLGGQIGTASIRHRRTHSNWENSLAGALRQVPIPAPLMPLLGSLQYIDLFLYLLDQSDELLLGLYRMRPPTAPGHAPVWYVVTNPHAEMLLAATDLGFVLRSSDVPDG
eukprot:jgi/Mesvir1/2989/Mv21646-RA.1